MASIESRIDTFIAEHEIDPLMKDDICALVTGCMEDLFKHLFNQPTSNMHFGNVLGYNDYEGSDINVVGTPHYNDVVYRLFAYSVGIDPNSEEELKSRQVEYGNYRFCFKTFSSKEMQQIQLGLIESELIQAVGRARVLRHDCVVELYSNLPLAGSIIQKAA